jgi:uncharacterized protein YbaA (DUF1428 family)
MNDLHYLDGFVAAVPRENQQAYLAHARAALPVFKDHGALRMVENWAEDVPVGKVTDFHRSVQKAQNETVVFSWVEWPSKVIRDAGMKALMEDERMKTIDMPFDGQRMIFGGFQSVVDEGSSRGKGYVDGIVIAVPTEYRNAYVQMASDSAKVFRENGALRIVEGWGDDVPVGKRTDFRRAVQAKDNETVVFSWVEWPSKQVRNDGWSQVMADARMQPGKVAKLFDGQRMIYGGFATILDA